MEFWKLNLRIGILEIKFERSWKFKNYLRMEILKIIKVWEVKVLKIKLKNWSFGNLFENESLEN